MIARAKARRACHENKRASWQQYVSRLNSRTTLKSTWDMVHRISGKYKGNTILHLKYIYFRIVCGMEKSNMKDSQMTNENALLHCMRYCRKCEHYIRS